MTNRTHWAAEMAKTAAVLLLLAVLTACTNTERFGGQPEPPAAAPALPPPPPPPQPPPVDLAGRWKLTSAGSSCSLTLGATVGAAAEGSVAPAGGCPGNFFTGRKWTYEHGMLIIRNYKGEPLAELAFANGGFEGKATNGAAVMLAH